MRNVAEFVQSVMLEGCQVSLLPAGGPSMNVTEEVRACADLAVWAEQHVPAEELPESFKPMLNRPISET